MFKRLLITICLLIAIAAFPASGVKAQQETNVINLTPVESSASSDSSTPATAAGTLEQQFEKKASQDITVSTPNQKSKLAAFLDANPIDPISWYNFLQHAIRQSVEKGLPANIIVLIILFPIIASAIAASRHLIGLQGFGVYIPAVLSVAFVSTGIMTGVITFIIVLLASVLFRTIFKKVKLQYLPRTAMMLWGVSVAVLILLIGTTLLNLSGFINISIFPLLIIILLTENFMETHLTVSNTKALQMTAETVIIAILCSLFISMEQVQQTVILHPEITILAVAIFNIITGKYSGLRFLEYIRFKSIMER